MPRGRPASILVVEDEAIVARDIQTTLRDLGYEVLDTAGPCEEAIHRASIRCPGSRTAAASGHCEFAQVIAVPECESDLATSADPSAADKNWPAVRPADHPGRLLSVPTWTVRQ